MPEVSANRYVTMVIYQKLLPRTKKRGVFFYLSLKISSLNRLASYDEYPPVVLCCVVLCLLCPVVFCCVVLCLFCWVLCCVVLLPFVSCCVLLWCCVWLCFVLSVLLCCVVLCPVVLCSVLLCLLCCVVSVVLCVCLCPDEVC